MDQHSDQASLIDLAAEIVSAYVSRNRVQPAELPSLIGQVHQALAVASTGGSREPAEPEQPKATAQQIRRSITPDHLVSFEDGKRYRTLRRHLTIRGLTPQAYREKWGLPADYPMVSPSYSQQRSEMAKSLGLGQLRRKGLAAVTETDSLKVEAFDAVAESGQGEAARDDESPAEDVTGTEPAGKRKRAGAPRTRKPKAEPATA